MRLGVAYTVIRPWSHYGVPVEERFMPQAFHDAGYQTAITGKWHLGSKPEWGPNQFGFDHSYGSLAGGVGPWNHSYKQGEFAPTWHRNEKLLTEPAASCTLAAAEHDHIMEVLDQTDWLIGGQQGAAARLGLPRTTLIYKMRKLGIDRARFA